jgi:hypothetical protein
LCGGVFSQNFFGGGGGVTQKKTSKNAY